MRECELSTADGSNNTHLFCHGEYCCELCSVTGFTNIDISGNYSLYMATVVDVEGTMSVFGYQSFLNGTIDNSGGDVDNSEFEVCRRATNEKRQKVYMHATGVCSPTTESRDHSPQVWLCCVFFLFCCFDVLLNLTLADL